MWYIYEVYKLQVGNVYKGLFVYSFCLDCKIDKINFFQVQILFKYKNNDYYVMVEVVIYILNLNGVVKMISKIVEVKIK